MKKLLMALPERFLQLLVKLISIKGLVFIIGTVLIYFEKISDWTWLMVAGIVIGGRTAEKIFGRNGNGEGKYTYQDSGNF